MENLVSDSILEKIQKLMALRDKPSCQQEADAATARINALLIKYNISMMQVENHKADDSGVEVLHGKYDDYQSCYEGQFAKQLIGSICYFNFCKMISFKSKEPMTVGGFTIIGKKHNIEITKYMYEYCFNNIKIFFDSYWNNLQFKEKKNMHRRAFYEGAVIALNVRLIQQKKEAEQEHGKNTMMGLMKLNDLAVQTKQNELFPLGTLKKGRQAKSCQNGDAKFHGYKAGEKLNLAKGLEADEDKKQLRN